MVCLQDKKQIAYTQLHSTQTEQTFQIKKIPAFLGNFHHLRKITLNYKGIENFDVFAQLPNLITLDLSNNIISNLNAFIAKEDQEEEKWKSLKYLTLSFNKIYEFKNLNLPLLQKLDLSNNEIKKIEEIQGLQNLQILKLDNNQISDTSSLKNLEKLKELYLGYNRIKTFQNFSGFENLQRLHLRSNYVNQQDNEY